MLWVKGYKSYPILRIILPVLAVVMSLAISGLHAQSAGQSQSQPPANAQPAQDVPDAPSAVQPPPPPKPALPRESPTEPAEKKRSNEPIPFPGDTPQQPAPDTQNTEAPPAMPPVETLPAGSRPRNQINPKEDLYTIPITTNLVQIPVMVKDSNGRRVDGLLPKDFTVMENGKKQTLTYFTSDPFELSVAVVLDIGIADVAFQKVNQTYSSLVGAFSPYDEVKLYTYSSTVSDVTDFVGKPEKLTAALNQLKLVRGHNNGPPVLGGPLGPNPPMANGIPIGGGPAPVNTPPREAHVLNDAILRAALDLSKRERTRRKLIFVISDGRELGSKASYREVLRVLETQSIQVKAVVLDSGALPLYRQLDKIHLKDQGYSNILPRYCSATGGGQVFTELSRNAIEEAYGQITSEARNQYTLAYIPKATAGSAYREIEVLVDKKGLNIYTKAGYYAVPTAH